MSDLPALLTQVAVEFERRIATVKDNIRSIKIIPVYGNPAVTLHPAPGDAPEGCMACMHGPGKQCEGHCTGSNTCRQSECAA